MNVWMRQRFGSFSTPGVLAMAAFVVAHVGCSKKDDEAGGQAVVQSLPADAADAGSASDLEALAAAEAAMREAQAGGDSVNPTATDPVARSRDAADPAGAPQPQVDPAQRGPSRGALSAADQMARIMPPAGAVTSRAPGEDVTPLTIASPDDMTIPLENSQRLELRADLSPEKLTQFLAAADKDMQLIASNRAGISDPQEALAEMQRIVKLKLQAARRLSQHADASAEVLTAGKRGELQSLSHLAALGDLKSAEALESLAKQNLEADDPRLVSDSRLVLIGFAIESLQNGDQDAPPRIVELTDQLAVSSSPPDAAAMMVLGQARQMLSQYGYDQQALKVRGAIIDLFADSSDPVIAEMAAQLAGNVQLDAINRLRAALVGDQQVAPARWQQAVASLVDESPDLQTVRYLAGAALELEAFGKQDFAEPIYEILGQRFGGKDAATGRELELALAARNARRSVIDRQFDPDLTNIDGTPLSIRDYRGKVVLMPFWATRFPESLQLLTQLEAIRDANPEDVAIVGMNLDVAGAPLAQFIDDNQIGFPSFWSESTPEAGNPVATQFGMVSMPFLAILDKQGKVAALNFTGRDLQATVEALMIAQ